MGDNHTPDIQIESWWINRVQSLKVTGPVGLQFGLLCQEHTTLRSNCSTPRDGLGGTQCVNSPVKALSHLDDLASVCQRMKNLSKTLAHVEYVMGKFCIR